MRIPLPFAALLLPTLSAAQVVQWQHLYQAGEGMVQATATATDTEGNVYITGFFAGQVDMDPGAGEHLLASAGDFMRDGFVASYASDGALRWAVDIDCSTLLHPKAIDTDASGGVVVTGTYTGTADLDPGPGLEEVIASSLDGFMLRLSASGAHVWSHVWSNTHPVDIHSVGLHPDGSVTCGLRYFATLDVDPGGAAHTITTGPPSDGAVLHLGASGAFLWVRRMNERGTAILIDLAVTPQGRIVGCGSFGDTLSLPGLAQLMAPTLGGHGFVFAMDAAGQGLWIHELEAPGPASGFTSIAAGADGRVAVTAQLNGTVDIDLSEQESDIDVQGHSPAYFVITADGGFLHSGVLQVSNGLSDLGEAHALAFGPEHDLWITGQWAGTIDTDPGPGAVDIAFLSNSYDCFLVHLDAAGSFLWSGTIAGPMANTGRGLAPDALGNTYLAAQVSNDHFVFAEEPDPPMLNGGFASSVLVKLAPGGMSVGPQEATTKLIPHPSPANEFVCITTERADGRLEVRSMDGALCLDQRITSMRTWLPLEGWAAGVYVVQWRSDGQVHHARFVKDRSR